ncbi:helicase-exonuclease AddAB subunit AddA [Alicyclobacillus acidiphilus]|uniref:helicase-exonuclease AddAB subunit AddA n=1 Tax=Alicyclobacillus acidiphilus TaxID=182455 RepID=UPI00083189FC|nr:helicase-exonuclease AddAB subunit AddA [Alicyclobacillus acidiphilus]
MKWSPTQARAIGLRGTRMVVSAGAGSGKTAVLVERVLSLLREDDGLTMDRFLVMTFTEAAAGEMRQRLASGIESAVEAARAAGDERLARRFRRELDLLWQAQISTIHSFCLSVIEQNPTVLGRSPRFRLMADNEQKVALRRFAEETVRQALAEEPFATEVRQMMTFLRLTDARSLTRVLIQLYELARSQVDPVDWLDQAANAYPLHAADPSTPFAGLFRQWVGDWLSRAVTPVEIALRLAEPVDELAKPAAWLRDALTALHAALDRLNSPGADLADVDRELRFFEGRAASISYKGWEADEIKTLRKMATDIVKKTLLPVLSRGDDALLDDLIGMAPHIRALTSLCQRLIDHARLRKAEDGVLDFNDLEHDAYQILSSDLTALARAQAKYAHVFVDEYQDTSPIQDAIVDLLTSRGDGLFAVGDVKQSIYRFRMAEPSLFLARYQRYARGDGGQSIDLQDNYRSRAEIVDFINFSFRQLFHVETTGFAYDEHVEMRSMADYPALPGDECVVEAHLFERDPARFANGAPESEDNQGSDGGAADDSGLRDGEADEIDETALEREAALVAARIHDMLAQETVVYDAKRGESRPVAFGDFAVLMRSGKAALNVVIDTLARHGIPAAGNTSTGFYDAMEIQWLIQALRAIDNPLDSLALVALLRSPLVGWDETLLAQVRLVAGGSYWHAVQSGARCPADHEYRAVAESCAAFLERFEGWRRLAGRVGVRELLLQLLSDTNLLLYLDGMPRGAARRANVAQLLQFAQAHDEREPMASLFTFLQQWREQEDAELDVGLAAPPEANSVQVMTIHRSKGLEFPIVFVIDLGKQFRLRPDDLPMHRKLGVGANAFDPATGQRWRTMAAIAAQYAEARETLAEEARILYVAFTRAKERLILVGSCRNLEQQVRMACYAHDLADRRLATSRFFAARTYLDWMLPVLLRHPQARALREFAGGFAFDGRLFETDRARLSVKLHVFADEAGNDGTDVGSSDELGDARTGIDWDRRLRELTLDPARPRVVQIRDRTPDAFEMIFSKVTATDMRRLHVATSPSGVRRLHVNAAASLLDEPVFVRDGGATPRDGGVAFHTFMQRCAWPPSTSLAALMDERDRLVEIGQLSPDLAAAVQLEDVAAFLESPLGRRMQKALRMVREQPFFHRIDVPAEEGGKSVSVIAQGVIDCLFEEEDGWVVVDYKTDRVDEAGVASMAREYEAQVATYLAALAPITADKPAIAYLYFVRPARAVTVRPMNLADVFLRLIHRDRTRLNERE